MTSTDPSLIWHNPTAVRLLALLAAALLLTTVWLFRRRKRSGHGAAIVCLVLSIALHAALFIWVPKLSSYFSGGGLARQEAAEGNPVVSVAVFDPEGNTPDLDAPADSPDAWPQTDQWPQTDVDGAALLQPLPLAMPIESLADSSKIEPPVAEEMDVSREDAANEIDSPPRLSETASMPNIPASLASSLSKRDREDEAESDPLDDWLRQILEVREPVDSVATSRSAEPELNESEASPPAMAASKTGSDSTASIKRQTDEDFASRQGNAKTQALADTGGDADTEAAVARSLKFLVSLQRADGSWDPVASGAGRERAPLGLERGSAGRRAETGLTGLALLALLGAGNTQQSGEYRDNVYRGLVFLLRKQRRDGSIAGDASVYAAHYCHAMASLSVAEAAAMTGDQAAIDAAARAIEYSRSTQHPVTGGWRYTRGDTGDLSQLGWQAMLIDGGIRCGAIQPDDPMQSGVARFLDSVRAGKAGGLACYRPGERPTTTMTAEALATRLLIGQKVPEPMIREAEEVILQALPGKQSGPDNYYYWYYATLALHQLQDETWRTWNEALKIRLLATQSADGSWPDSTLWGGYGGTVYTTSMATLCLETYYRHSIR